MPWEYAAIVIGPSLALFAFAYWRPDLDLQKLRDRWIAWRLRRAKRSKSP